MFKDEKNRPKLRVTETRLPIIQSIPTCCTAQKPGKEFAFFEENESKRITTQVVVLDGGRIRKLSFWSPVRYEADTEIDETEDVPGLKLMDECATKSTPMIRVQVLFHDGSKWQSLLSQPIIITSDQKPVQLQDFTGLLKDGSVPPWCLNVVVLQREYLTDKKCPNLVRIET